MAKTILMIHGRHFKPAKSQLEKLWFEALSWGIERDHPAKLSALKKARVEMVYYGDVSNAFLGRTGRNRYDQPSDLRDRREAIDALKQFKKSQFTAKTYEKLQGVAKWKELAAWAFGDVLGALHLTDAAIGQFAPDIREYWNPDSEFGSAVRYPMIDPLRAAMDRNDEIMVISHSLGTMISYDTFWKFSHCGEYRDDYSKRKITRWITLGSPLADETVKRNLKGAKASGRRRYPTNVESWINVSAEDDFISHDAVVANDYQDMKALRLIRSITDKRIYNLSVRGGRSNPHHVSGYLLHPYVAGVVAKWL